jgi:hypothetical protein
MNQLNKNFRQRALRAKRELKKEMESTGYIRDGSGRRYRVGVFHFIAGDIIEASEAFDWFEKEFPEDIGEPVHHLYSALAAYRLGNEQLARHRLGNTLVSNIYLLPHVVGNPIERMNIWHSSNRCCPEYLSEVAELLEWPSTSDRKWIDQVIDSPTFCALQSGYISTHQALLAEQDFNARVKILRKWDLLKNTAWVKG